MSLFIITTDDGVSTLKIICKSIDDMTEIILDRMIKDSTRWLTDSLKTNSMEIIFSYIKDLVNQHISENDMMNLGNNVWYKFEILEHQFSPLLVKDFEMAEKTPQLLKENEELRKRNIFLECEPYRGPEFFNALEEEKSSGLLS